MRLQTHFTVNSIVIIIFPRTCDAVVLLLYLSGKSCLFLTLVVPFRAVTYNSQHLHRKKGWHSMALDVQCTPRNRAMSI